MGVAICVVFGHIANYSMTCATCFIGKNLCQTVQSNLENYVLVTQIQKPIYIPTGFWKLKFTRLYKLLSLSISSVLSMPAAISVKRDEEIPTTCKCVRLFKLSATACACSLSLLK